MLNIDKKFILIGFVYLLIGMVHGLYMAYVGNYLFTVVHAHTLLVGGFLMILYGILHRLYASLREDKLSTLQFWLANIGAPTFAVGIWLAVSGITDWIGHIGASLSIIGIVLFAMMTNRLQSESNNN